MRGLTPDTAIVVSGVREEYAWLNANYPGHRVLAQRLIDSVGRPMDVVSIATADGGRVDVFFDISRFFGRPREQTSLPLLWAAPAHASRQAKPPLWDGWHDDSTG